MKKIVTKFGGSSLADAEQFAKVRRILSLDPARRYVVPSAPGRRFKEDEKVTDLLYRCHHRGGAKGRITRIPLTKLPPATWILPRSCTWGWTWARPWTR